MRTRSEQWQSLFASAFEAQGPLHTHYGLAQMPELGWDEVTTAAGAACAQQLAQGIELVVGLSHRIRPPSRANFDKHEKKFETMCNGTAT